MTTYTDKYEKKATTKQLFLIDDTNFLLIDDTNKLEIQSEKTGTTYTNKYN